MSIENEIIWCSGCGVEITWGAIKSGERYYCCEDCLQGSPCECGRRMELEESGPQRKIVSVVELAGTTWDSG